MKKIRAMLAILLPFSMILLMGSCKKEFVNTNNPNEEIATASNRGPVTRAFRDSFEIWLKFKPNIPGGWNPANPYSLVWWPGYGEGNATHMGNVSIYFNGYTVGQPSGGVYIFPAPVTMFFATELQSYNLPQDVDGIISDDKGNSIWVKNDPNGIPSSPVSPSMITFSGKSYITGGTGKFAGATGETTLTGYFDPSPLQTNPSALLPGTLWSYGWIRY